MIVYPDLRTWEKVPAPEGEAPNKYIIGKRKGSLAWRLTVREWYKSGTQWQTQYRVVGTFLLRNFALKKAAQLCQSAEGAFEIVDTNKGRKLTLDEIKRYFTKK